MVLVAVWLLLGFGVTGDRLDAIRTGGTLGVGLGGVVVLWLSVRPPAIDRTGSAPEV